MNGSTLYILRQVIKRSKKYWPQIIGLFFLNLMATPIALLKPYALKLLIDSAFGTEPVPGFIQLFFPSGYQFDFEAIVWISAFFVVAIAFIDHVYSFISWVAGTKVGEMLVLNFRTILFNHIQRLSIAYHDKKGVSDSLFRIQWDSVSARSLLIDQVSPLFSSFLTLVSMIGVMFYINWQFGLIAICVIPPLVVLTKLSTKVLKKDWFKVKEAESQAMSVLHEVLGSLRIVKAFGQEDAEGNRYLERSNKAVKGQVRLARIGAVFQFLVGMFLAIGTAAFFYIGAKFVKGGGMTLGELTLVLAYLVQIFSPLQNIIKLLNDIQSSIAGLDRVFTVLESEKEVKEAPNAISLNKVKGHLELKNVSFYYSKEKPILEEVSFSIRPGDKVGIMGSSGAGKSTLISLIMRFYDPGSGNIFLDGIDIKKYKLKDYRKHFSLVLQEPVLFSSSFAENIKYGRPDATESEIIEAAKAANAHDFIMRTKDGYDTLVGERGMQLSGGERQRISIARAFIKNAPILIMDEPTSSLDVRTEAQIMEAIERLLKGRTSFIITHRLDTLNSCNVIVHLEKGKLADFVRDHEDGYLTRKKDAFLNE